MNPVTEKLVAQVADLRIAALEPHWRAVTIKGSGPVAVDPFDAFLEVDSAAVFVNNWGAMRALPAIRQAINEWLVDVIQSQH